MNRVKAERLCVVGCGLMGGSLLMALKGKGYEAWVVDAEEAVVAEARGKGLGAHYGTDPGEGMAWADLVVLCVMPETALEIVKRYGKSLRAGTVLTDFCGVKKTLAAQVESHLPQGVQYVGAHPMAGRERGSLAFAVAELYRGANALLIPLASTSESALKGVETLLTDLGCGRVTVCSTQTHDSGIAFTSQLMHVLAASLANHPLYSKTVGYEGGSLRDCTRVATLDPQMWTALCMENRESLLPVIEDYIGELKKFSRFLEDGDKDGLSVLFGSANEAKERRTRAFVRDIASGKNETEEK